MSHRAAKRYRQRMSKWSKGIKKATMPALGKSTRKEPLDPELAAAIERLRRGERASKGDET